jgi:hypothetical protein
VAADGDLADLTAGHVLAEGTDQPQLDAVDRGADGAGLAYPVGVVERGDRGGL